MTFVGCNHQKSRQRGKRIDEKEDRCECNDEVLNARRGEEVVHGIGVYQQALRSSPVLIKKMILICCREGASASAVPFQDVGR